MKGLISKLRDDPLSFEWRKHGIGFIKAYLDIERTKRVHIYNKYFLTPNITIHHTHPWHFYSEILTGELVNTRFVIDDESQFKFKEGVINCCDFKGIEGIPKTVGLRPEYPEIYTSTNGEYSQASNEIHMTEAADGTVTLVTLIPANEQGIAKVYWPIGSEYVNADISDLTEEDILKAIDCI